LPWRNTADAYAIYISEVMLQQTQVKTVLERFYAPFLARFPTLATLAEAPQDAVLSAWHGLGYYSRALNVQRVAKACPDGLPDDVERLLALPGIGRNTAHAVAAFAYRQPYAVMEANVRRVVCRIFALELPKETELWAKAAMLLDAADPFDYNQAMMDVGAMLCTKRDPACSACPAQGICLGKDEPKRYPAPKISKLVPVRHKRIWVLQDETGRYFATPRESRFLHGLYWFGETDAADERFITGAISCHLEEAIVLGQVRQQYSHFTLEAEVVVVRQVPASGDGWHSPEALLALPVSMAEKKVMALLGLEQGRELFLK
jgi:A/G-specific adenine glycosylase